MSVHIRLHDFTTFHPSNLLKSGANLESIKFLWHSIKESISGSFIIFIRCLRLFSLSRTERKGKRVKFFRLIFCGEGAGSAAKCCVLCVYSHQVTSLMEGFSQDLSLKWLLWNVALIHCGDIYLGWDVNVRKNGEGKSERKKRAELLSGTIYIP